MPELLGLEWIVIHGFVVAESTGRAIRIQDPDLDAEPGDTIVAPVFSEPVALKGQSPLPLLRALAANGHVRAERVTTTPNDATGYYAVASLSTNDPDGEPYAGRKVTLPDGTSKVIQLPFNAVPYTVDQKMADQVNAGRSPAIVTVGQTVRAVWLPAAAEFVAPDPGPPAFYTAEEVDALLASAGAPDWAAIQNKPDLAELARDTLGAALQSGTGINIGVDDAGDHIVVSSTVAAYSDEQAQDAAAALILAGNHVGLTPSYDDAGNALSFTVTGGGGGGGGAAALTETPTKTANFTAAATQAVPLDTSGGTFTLTFPTGAAIGAQVAARWVAGTVGPTISAPSGETIGAAQTATMSLAPGSSSGEFIVWQKWTSTKWLPIGGFKPQSALTSAFAPATTVASSTRTVTASTTAAVGESLFASAASGSVVVTPPSSPPANARVLLLRTDTPAAGSSNTVSWNGPVSGDSQGVTIYSGGAGVGLIYSGSAWWIEYWVGPFGTTTAGGGGGSAPTAAGVRNGSYSAHRNVYLPAAKTNTVNLRGHLARAATGELVNLVVAGDSRAACVLYGPATGWVSQLRGRMAAAGIPSAGTGLVLANMFGGTGTTPIDARLTFSGSGWSFANPPVRTWTASGATATFSTTASGDTGTIAEVYYQQGNGAFGVVIDGGSSTTVPASSGSGIAKWTSPVLSNGTHTVTVTTSSTAGNLVGFCLRTTSGLLIHNLGVGGWTSSLVASTAAGSVQAVTSFINPSVYGLMVGCNDPAQGTPIPASTTQANLVTILGTNNSAAAKFLLVQTPNDTYSAGWGPYVQAQYNAADIYGTPLLDLNDRFVSPAAANTAGLIASDLLHETVAGVNDIARATASMLAA